MATSKAPIEVYIAQAQRECGCWPWPGYRIPKGYGRFGQVLAHRAVYEALVGPIPSGCVLHHKCGVKPCVNPEHLELMPDRAHRVRHGLAFCGKGHAMTPDNVYRFVRRHPTTGRPCLARYCKACDRAKHRVDQ